jgi:hypothetical protein
MVVFWVIACVLFWLPVFQRSIIPPSSGQTVRKWMVYIGLGEGTGHSEPWDEEGRSSCDQVNRKVTFSGRKRGCLGQERERERGKVALLKARKVGSRGRLCFSREFSVFQGVNKRLP